MKNLSILAISSAIALLTFTSCENDNNDLVTNDSIETVAIEESLNRTFTATTIPETIQEVRDAGINVSRRIERLSRGSLDRLLNRHIRGLRERDQRAFRRIRSQFARLVAQIENQNGGEAPDVPEAPEAPNPTPIPPVGVILTVADLDLSADAQNALRFGSSIGTDTNRINGFVRGVSNNNGRFTNAGNGNLINQNGIEVTADETVESILFSFRRILDAGSRTPNLDSITEEFRPLAINAVNNLVGLLNAEGGTPINPPSGI